MEPGSILPETAHYQLSTDVFDDIIALEITEVSPDLVVLQLKEDSLEGSEGGAYKYEVDVGEQCPMFSLDTSKKDDSWRAPVGIPVEGLTDGQVGEYCGMVVNGTAEEADSTYTIPEACSGNLEIQFYPCEFCEASYTDEQELETHVSDSHNIRGAKRNERDGMAPRIISEEGTEPGQRPFHRSFTQPEMPIRKISSNPLQCVVCGRIFKRPKSFQRHQWYHTWRQGVSNGTSVQKQKPVSTQTLNQCSKCGRTYKEREMLDRHQQICCHSHSVIIHRGLPDLLKNMSPLRCCECDRYFGTKETFHKHQCFHLRKQLRAFKALGRKNKDLQFFHCQLCALPFTGGLEFEHHIKRNHPEQYKKATRTKCFSGKTMQKRSGALEGKTVGLEKFEYGFPPLTVDPEEEAAIIEEQNSETVQLFHPCPECGKLFNRQVMLNRHHKMYHYIAETRQDAGNTNYGHKCIKCDIIFRTRRVLQRHRRLHHKKKKCCECSRCFGDAKTFYDHQCFHLRKQLRAFCSSGRKPTGAKFFQCQLCALKFRKGLEFEQHVRVTHPEQYKKATRRKKYAGKTMGMRSGSLKGRARTVRLEGAQRGFPPLTVDPEEETAITKLKDTETVQLSHLCPECGKLFNTQVMLKRHQKMYHNAAEARQQTGNVSYGHHKCIKCDKTFRTRRVLQKHKRMHHKKNILKCCECGRRFGAAETFYKHQCFHLRKQLRAFYASGRKPKGVKFLHCQLCALKFTEGLEFEHHIKVTHLEQYKKVTRRHSARKTRKEPDSGPEIKGTTFGKSFSVSKASARISRQKSKVGDEGAQTDDTSGLCSVEANIAEQGSKTSGPLHQCSKCGRTFKGSKMLDRHQRIYHRDQATIFPRNRRYPALNLLRCFECGRQFSSTEIFHRHQCFHLRKQLRAFNASNSKSKGPDFFNCQLCTVQFTEGQKFEQHVKVTHPEQFKKAAKNKSSSEKTTKTQESEVDNNGTALDEQAIVTKAHVKIDVVKPKVEDKSAQTGDAAGLSSVSASTHKQGAQTSGLQHQCSKCGRAFKWRKILDRHQRIYHRGQSAVFHRGGRHPPMSLLRCCECDRHFSTTETFRRHQCFHLRKQLRAFSASGKKDKGFNFFHCQLCSVQFTEGLKFEHHVKVTHPEQYKKAAKNKSSAVRTTKK